MTGWVKPSSSMQQDLGLRKGLDWKTLGIPLRGYSSHWWMQGWGFGKISPDKAAAPVRHVYGLDLGVGQTVLGSTSHWWLWQPVWIWNRPGWVKILAGWIGTGSGMGQAGLVYGTHQWELEWVQAIQDRVQCLLMGARAGDQPCQFG